MLKAQGLRSVRDGQQILANVDVIVEPGESLAVTGPSGSGKTTLLSLLSGLARPTAGEVYIDGKPLTKFAGPALGVAVVLQGYGLVSLLTAAENIEVAMRAAGRTPAVATRTAREVLAELGLEAHADQLVEELSGGQQQRTAVARALALEPRLLIADEPTAELDPAARAVALARMFEVAINGGSLVLATHDPEVAARCDRILDLSDGGTGQDEGPGQASADQPPLDHRPADLAPLEQARSDQPAAFRPAVELSPLVPLAAERAAPADRPAEQPPVELSPAEQPPTDRPVAEYPGEQPPAEQPFAGQPPAEQPAAEQAPIDQPAAEYPAGQPHAGYLPAGQPTTGYLPGGRPAPGLLPAEQPPPYQAAPHQQDRGAGRRSAPWHRPAHAPPEPRWPAAEEDNGPAAPGPGYPPTLGPGGLSAQHERLVGAALPPLHRRGARLRSYLEEVRRRAYEGPEGLDAPDRQAPQHASPAGLAPAAAAGERELLRMARDDLAGFADLGLRLLELHQPMDLGAGAGDPASSVPRCLTCMWRWPCPTFLTLAEIMENGPEQA